MAEQSRPEDDKTMPNRASNMKKAEGDRDTVEPTGNAGGVSNRPLSREEKEQDEVPPRGRAKEGGHA